MFFIVWKANKINELDFVKAHGKSRLWPDFLPLYN
jgi:hypothetical protein